VTSLRASRAVAVALVTFATFTDIVAYAVAIPVLPDLSRRLGASPTTIGFLFASFGVTLVSVSIPAGALSDRSGRKGPIVGGLVALAAATQLFAVATSLPWLFAARLVQGAADAVTWVVGFALIADLYSPEERGRVAGIVMSGTSCAVMIGPSLGGWLYEVGGIRLPFTFVTALAIVAAIGFLWLEPPTARADREMVPIGAVLRTPAVASCAAVVVVLAATLSMLEPVLALQLSTHLGIGPARSKRDDRGAASPRGPGHVAGSAARSLGLPARRRLGRDRQVLSAAARPSTVPAAGDATAHALPDGRRNLGPARRCRRGAFGPELFRRRFDRLRRRRRVLFVERGTVETGRRARRTQ